MTIKSTNNLIASLPITKGSTYGRTEKSCRYSIQGSTGSCNLIYRNRDEVFSTQAPVLPSQSRSITSTCTED